MKILDQENTVRENFRRLMTDYRVYVLLVIFTQIADSISTTLFMMVTEIDYELNPVVRWLSHRLGIAFGPLIGKTVQLAAMFGLVCIVPNLTRVLCWAVISMNTIAVIRNLDLYWSTF